MVPIDKIERDCGTQRREKVDRHTVERYRDAMLAGDEFPPVLLFFDGKKFWLADGEHRIRATLDTGLQEINAEVRTGKQRDAQWESLGVNLKHGLPPTAKERRAAIVTALQDPEWTKYTDRKIADHCGAHHDTVGRIRAELKALAEAQLADPPTESAPAEPATRVGADGKTYKATKPSTKKDKPAKGSAAAPKDEEKPAAPEEQPAAPATTEAAPAGQPEKVIGPDGEDLTGAAIETPEEQHAEYMRVLDQNAELRRIIEADDTRKKMLDIIRQRDNALSQYEKSQTRTAELDKDCRRLSQQLLRCGKIVGEKDYSMIAPKLEALVRTLRGRLPAKEAAEA
jgi:ParB-like chromosome segregation protein Spo0J